MKLKCELMLGEVHTWACLKNCLCFSCSQASAKVIKYDALEIEVNAVVISNNVYFDFQCIRRYIPSTKKEAVHHIPLGK